jgi:hypothetical protein
MVVEMNKGALFHFTVPCRPFEIEGTGWTEVIFRHGRERQVEVIVLAGSKVTARGQKG